MTQTHTLRGTFDVQMTPLTPAPEEAEANLGHLLLRKQFHGELDATGLGHMLAFRSAEPSSAGYVAMERVEGRVAGRSGSFMLMHFGEMNRGTPKLIVQVVPDSGTGELVGLSGTLSIDVRDGKHFYEFSYYLPAE
ncbi:DUF3224 domain-containing protein [Roseateles sp. UC29_93]|uniref:DUF3224 domain-containing protein n=1 Tax=Roseateles sp. UC29_93 TaxID=3350177 RepID=UPI00366F90EA